CAPPPGSGAGGTVGSVGVEGGTSGAVDETPPPLVGLCPVAEAHGIATSTAASVNVRPRRRNSLQTLFRVPPGLADGLARKEQRSSTQADKVRPNNLVPPVPKLDSKGIRRCGGEHTHPRGCVQSSF